MRNQVLIALFVIGSASAQGGLYPSAPPSNSAFVRVIGVTSASLGGTTISAKRNAASAYLVIPQGIITAKAGGIVQKINVQAGKFYSVIVSGNKLILLTDQTADNKAKALLTIYNLTSKPLDLKTTDGKLSVVPGVKPASSGSRAVNGIVVDLSVFVGDKATGTVKSVKLESGEAYALVATTSGLTITQSTTK